MSTPLLEIEGTWEEIKARAPDFAGRRLHVIILPADEHDALPPEARVDAEDTLGALIDACKADTGIPDLAHQHDHYVHGKAKKE